MINLQITSIRTCKDPANVNSYKAFQLPLAIEDMRSEMIVEFEDPCSTAACFVRPSMTLKEFTQKYHKFDPGELAEDLTIDFDQFGQILSQLVPCVGCRKSVEKLFFDLEQLPGMPSIYPMTIGAYGITCDPKVLKRPELLYDLLISKWSKVQSGILENLTKCRKNKRCQLHCLDMQLLKGKAYWSELWAIMSEESRDESCIIDTSCMLDMLEGYIQKHRFCSECKVKVLKAYSLLVGELKAEPGFNASVYDGLHFCAAEDHLHLKTCDEFLNNLCSRAEPEVFGSGRERHAKTIEVAQGEVVLCLGLYMYDRLHKIVSSLKSLDQTFQIIYCAGVVAMHNAFQMALERKFGAISRSLENLCAELQDSLSAAAAATANSSSVNKAAKKKQKKLKDRQQQKQNAQASSKNRDDFDRRSLSSASSTANLPTASPERPHSTLGRPLQAPTHRNGAVKAKLGRKGNASRSLSPVLKKSSVAVAATPLTTPPKLVSAASAALQIKDDFSDAGYSSSSSPVISEQRGASESNGIISTVPPSKQHSSCYASKNKTTGNAASVGVAINGGRGCFAELPLAENRIKCRGVVAKRDPGNGCCNCDAASDRKNRHGGNSLLAMLEEAQHADACNACGEDCLNNDAEESDEPLISREDIEWFERNKAQVSSMRVALREEIRAKFSALVEQNSQLHAAATVP